MRFVFVVAALTFVVSLAGVVVVWRFEPEAFIQTAVLEWHLEYTKAEKRARAERLAQRFHRDGGRCLRYQPAAPIAVPRGLDPDHVAWIFHAWNDEIEQAHHASPEHVEVLITIVDDAPMLDRFAARFRWRALSATFREYYGTADERVADALRGVRRRSQDAPCDLGASTSGCGSDTWGAMTLSWMAARGGRPRSRTHRA